MEKPLRFLSETCRSEETFRTYETSLNAFLRWAHKDYQSLLLLPEQELVDLFVEYLVKKKSELTPNSIQPIYSAIAKFLKANRKKFDADYVRSFLPEKRKPTQGKAWSDEDVKKMLEYADTTRAKALIHFLCASGCRIGEVEELKLKHIEPMSEGCRSVKVYAGSRHEHPTFLHSEAVMVLSEYWKERENDGEPLTEESPAFSSVLQLKQLGVRPMSKKSGQELIKRVILKAKIERKREESSPRFEIALDQGFRVRWATKMKMNPAIPDTAIRQMMDHTGYLDGSYVDVSKEKLFEFYLKAIPDIMISEEWRLRLEQKRNKEKITELQKNKTEINHLKVDVDYLTQSMSEMIIRDSYYENMDALESRFTKKVIETLKKALRTNKFFEEEFWETEEAKLLKDIPPRDKKEGRFFAKSFSSKRESLA